MCWLCSGNAANHGNNHHEDGSGGSTSHGNKSHDGDPDGFEGNHGDQHNLPQPSPQCRNVFLLSLSISEFGFPTEEWMILNYIRCFGI